MMLDLNFKEKTALVSGGSRGIGWAIAQGLASVGCRIILMARNENQLQKNVAALCADWPQDHRYLRVDLDEQDTLSNHLADIRSMGIDILINNTGGPAGGPLLEASTDALSHAFSRHILSYHTLTKAVVPHMKEREYGRIINIVSTSVRQPIDGLGVSNTIRAAVSGWAKTLSNELAPFGITMNNILPGTTPTERVDEIFTHMMTVHQSSKEEIAAQWLARIPMGRFGELSEMAAAAIFLASPSAGFITGVSLPVDGGTIKSI